MILDPRTLDRLLTIEQAVVDDSLDGAGSSTWVPIAKVWANVQDVLPSRGERLAGGLNVATRPARVRFRYRSDITPDMRFVLGTRVMQITAGPAELGRRGGLEFMAEDYTSAGNSA